MSSSLLAESRAPLLSNAFADFDRNFTPHYTWNVRFRLESERLKTFENWPLEWLDKNTLATTGMFYTGVNDHTKCYFCEIIIGKWERSDDPVQEHLRWSPNCPLLQRRVTDNIALNAKDLELLLTLVKHCTYDTPPTPSWMPIPSPDYSLKMVRLKSFAEWPTSIKQRPEELSEAGFYYKGIGDSVICFSCQGGLKDWEEEDDPWEQHALWMGHNCPYVKLVKGEDYIKSVHNKFKNDRPNEMEQNYRLNEIEQKIEQTQEVVQPTAATSLELEHDYKLCKICFDKECNTAYVPCGHVVACPECALSAKDCPLCRALIKSVVRLYFS